jgi:hypothetical protein
MISRGRGHGVVIDGVDGGALRLRYPWPGEVEPSFWCARF